MDAGLICHLLPTPNHRNKQLTQPHFIAVAILVLSHIASVTKTGMGQVSITCIQFTKSQGQLEGKSKATVGSRLALSSGENKSMHLFIGSCLGEKWMLTQAPCPFFSTPATLWHPTRASWLALLGAILWNVTWLGINKPPLLMASMARCACWVVASVNWPDKWH